MIWDINNLNNKLIKYYKYNTVDISNNGRYLLYGTEDNVIKVWDIANSVEIGHLYVENIFLPNICVKFTNDSTRIYAVMDYLITSWTIPSCSVIANFSMNAKKLTFSNDGKNIVYLQDKMLHLFDIESQVIMQSTSISDFHGVHFIKYTPDGHCLMIAHYDGSVSLWDCKSLKVISAEYIKSPTKENRNNPAITILNSSDGNKFIIGFDDGSYLIHDYASPPQTIEECIEFVNKKGLRTIDINIFGLKNK